MQNIFSIHKEAPPGVMPGFINISESALKPKVRVYSYDKESLFEFEEETPDPVVIHNQLESKPQLTHWVDIKGLGSKDLLEEIAKLFSIHRLELEDVVNVYQRPKLEEYPDHLFLISRMLRKGTDIFTIQNNQLSIFLGPNFVITFQEKYDDFFEPVRDRIKHSKGFIRSYHADYLAYALMDAVVDNYFPLLEEIGEKLDDLEMEMLIKPSRYSLRNLIQMKRQLITFRRTIWAERDKINDLLRTSTELVSDNCKLYLRDTYDHCIQVLDLVESYKEITSSMMDIYLSSVSNRMNQIMKVLAVISTIFIPLTFIVGVYGMNFSRQDPVTGKILTMNMPELYSPYGYVGVWAFMFIMVLVQIYIFFKKGWLTRQ